MDGQTRDCIESIARRKTRNKDGKQKKIKNTFPPKKQLLTLFFFFSQHHHRTNLDKYHPGYFGKVGMRRFHLLRNHQWNPVINVDKVRDDMRTLTIFF